MNYQTEEFESKNLDHLGIIAGIITQVASYAIASASGCCMGSVCIIKSPPGTKTEGKMLNEIIAIYAITDDLLKAIGHHEDSRREMSDAEIMTTAMVAAMFFSGNHSAACNYMK